VARGRKMTNGYGNGLAQTSLAALCVSIGLGACVQIAGIEEPILDPATGGSGNAGEGGAAGGGPGGSGSSSGAGGSGGAMGACTPGTSRACYTGPMNTQGVGQCVGGMQTCAGDGTAYGACMGEVLPGTEVCGNSIDEDCDGNMPTGPGCFVNTNLIVRYFLDEAESGIVPTSALDSAPAPLDLPITYDTVTNQMMYTSAATGRGLQWLAADGPGVARAVIDGTKVYTMLNGKQQGTIEVVARVDGATGNHNRLFAISNGINNPFSLGTYSTPVFAVQANGADVGRWSANFAGIGRAVLHVVLDTTDAIPTNRVRFYVDGVLQTPVAGTPPPQNGAITIGAGFSICLGNRDTQGRSMYGALYYAALYAGALTAAEVATNAAVLKASDDK
jgi:hypothetical protein